MDKQEIIEKLEEFKVKLSSDVFDAYKQRGQSFGEQRVKSWKKSFLHFLDSNVPNQSINLDEIAVPLYFDIYSGVDVAGDFWRSQGEPFQSCIDSLIVDIQDGEYDFTPINKEVKQVETTPKAKSNKVFIVHGHDGETKYRTANFLRQHGLDPIILHLKASRNRTIIEKLEKYTEDVGYGIVLYTPDDLGQVKSKASNGELDNRARQNVIFEHGYLMGLIGRENVVAIVKGDIELPNDISGVVYIDDADWEKTLLIELRDAGYALNIANL